MDHNSQGIFGDTIDHISSQTTCALCQRIRSSDNETYDLEESISICGDCKFLLLEDIENTSPDVYPRRINGSRRRRYYESSESIESIFSQQFSQIIRHENQSASNGDVLVQQYHTSSRTTPSGSRRWRRVFSDTESDGFDSFESESNVSFRRYRHGEADALSYSVYGGNSDASVDGQNFLENENENGGSELESDTDIDPMNAGLYHWNSDDDDSEWEEVDVEGNMAESLRTEDHLIDWRRQLWSPEVEGTIPFRIRDRIRAHTADLLTNFEDYPDARGLEILLDETESSRMGAPPASVSFVNNLPQRSINRDDDDELDSLACAICKDSFIVGTLVNQLPCFHLYHPLCLLPWLNARNTCPLCRYELPTDDKDYEERKMSRRLHVNQRDVNQDVDDFIADEPRGREETARNNRWLFLAAAPIVSMVGISLMLWLGGGKHTINRRSDQISIPRGRDDRQRRWRLYFF